MSSYQDSNKSSQIPTNGDRKVVLNMDTPHIIQSDRPDSQEDITYSEPNSSSHTRRSSEADLPLEHGFTWTRQETQKRPDHVQHIHSKEKTNLSRTRCSSCVDWYNRWPFFLRMLLYSITGGALIMVPGMISFFFYIGKHPYSCL